MSEQAKQNPEDRILERLTDHAAGLDELTADAEPTFNARVRELMDEPTERNDAIWLAALEEADMDESVLDIGADDLGLVPVAERKQPWADALAVIISTAQAQAYIERVGRQVIEHADEVSADVSRIDADAEDWHKAARKGVSKRMIADRVEARKAERATKAQQGAT